MANAVAMCILANRLCFLIEMNQKSSKKWLNQDIVQRNVKIWLNIPKSKNLSKARSISKWFMVQFKEASINGMTQFDQWSKWNQINKMIEINNKI